AKIDIRHARVAEEPVRIVEVRARVRAIAPLVVRTIAIPPTGRRPTDVVRAIHPVDPRGRVTRSRKPHPPLLRIDRPPSLLIRHPSPRLIRDPDQRSTAAVTPLTVVIRTPSRGNARTPAPRVERVDVDPAAVLREIIVGVCERAIEITARSMSVRFGAAEEPA